MATTKNLSKGVALLGAVALCCVALYAGRLRRVAVPAADHHTPLVAAPGLRCFSSGALAATPRFQSFCFVDRLCHDTRNVFHVPRPRRGTLSARAVRAWGALASQHRLAVSASDLWRDYAQSTDVLFYSGLSTAHFPEWVDAPLFLFAYQRNAWRWKLPRVREGEGIGRTECLCGLNKVCSMVCVLCARTAGACVRRHSKSPES